MLEWLLGKKDKSSNSSLQKFLNEADEVYVNAFKYRDTREIRKYCTPMCTRNIGAWIAHEASNRYFSDSKMRETEWSTVSETDDKIVMKKSCSFKEFKYSMLRSMKVSEDFEEEWIILKTDGGYLIDSIVETSRGGLYG